MTEARWLERASPVVWASGGVVSLALGIVATVPLTGIADVLSVGAGVSGLAFGVWAARARRGLDRLPLRVAPRPVWMASSSGRDLVLRAVLGRGRRVDRLEVSASLAGEPCAVHHAHGPLVGPFLVVVPLDAADGGELVLILRAHASTEVHEHRLVTQLDQVEAGRFVAVREGGVWLDADRFDRLRP